MSECEHPKSEVTITETTDNTGVGDAPPRFWTVFGHCSSCQESVELDYELYEIL